MGYSKIQTNSISIKPSIQNSISLKNVNLISNGNDIFSYPLSNNDELSFIKFNGQLPYNSIVPHKHGEYSLSGSVFASGFANNDVAPYKAFTYNTTDKWQVDTITGIIGYEFTEPKLIYKYEISCHSLTNINMAPKTWTFEGYNEDTFFWDVLDTQTNIVLTATDFTRTIFITNPTTKYKKYRLNITVNSGNATSLSINHIKLYEVYDKLDMNNKVRIELDERTKLYLYKITNGVCDIYEKNSVYEFVIPNTNQEYSIYFYLNDNGSIVFEGNNIYNFKQNSFPLCSIFINSNNEITNFNKLNKFNYSIIVDVYRYKTTKPTPRTYMNSEAYNTDIFCIGGYSLTNATEMYSTDIDSWTSKTNKTTASFASISGIENNNIHVAGGYASAVIIVNQKYNITNDNWSSNLSMPSGNGRHGAMGKLVNDNLYVISGCVSTTPLVTNYAYNILDNTWSTKTEITIGSNYGHSSNIGLNIYCMNGQQPYTNRNACYSTNTNSWISKTPNIIQKHSATASTINNIIYCIGGTTNPAGTLINESYNAISDSWMTENNTPQTMSNYTSNVIDNTIFCFGSNSIQYIPSTRWN